MADFLVYKPKPSRRSYRILRTDRGYRVVGRIAMPVDNEERGRPLARCTLRSDLASLWPQIVAASR